MSKSRTLMVVGTGALALGAAGVVVRSLIVQEADVVHSLSLAAVFVGLGALLVVLVIGQRSMRKSHDLLRNRTQRIAESTTESRASIGSVASQVRFLDDRFTLELDKRQLEWFEAAEVLEQKITDLAKRQLEWFEVAEVLEQKITDLASSSASAYFLEMVKQLEADIARDTQTTVRHLEAVMRICSGLPLRRPLPAFDDWTVAPDLAAEILDRIFVTRPSIVVETGSGLSTVLIGYALEVLGEGRVVSLEHDEKYWKQTTGDVRAHGLEQVVSVIHAPLVDYELGGEHFRWYSLDAHGLPDQIDMLLVDGPPAATNPQARYPAWPLLSNRLSPSAQVILDDADRPDEAEIVRRWLADSDGWLVEKLVLQRGATVLTRHA